MRLWTVQLYKYHSSAVSVQEHRHSRANLVSESPAQSLAHLLAAQDALLEETRPLEWPKGLPVCDSTMQPLHR